MPAEGFKRQLAASLSLALAPVALPQGLYLRRSAMRLEEATGERSGTWPGTGHGIRLLAVGESPLAGVGLESPVDTVASRLAQQLAGTTGRSAHWRILARGGFTAGAVLNRLVTQLDPAPADLILIGLGVNDSLRLRSARRWQQDLTDLIEALRTRTGPAAVLLAGVPDMRRFPLLPNPLRLLLGTRSRLLDHAAAELAGRMTRCDYVPMVLDARAGHLFCDDGFHPNRDGHAQWAEQLAPAALDLLRHGERPVDAPKPPAS